MDLDRLNALAPDRAHQAFLDCCGAPGWAAAMAAGRPYSDVPSLLDQARTAWEALDPSDQEPAFAAHPRIGERSDDAGRHARWSRREQRGVDAADTDLLRHLTECNREYEHRFGRVYLVYASGKTAAEMLADCQERLGNDPERERVIAAAEQEKITDLRLRRLLGVD